MPDGSACLRSTAARNSPSEGRTTPCRCPLRGLFRCAGLSVWTEFRKPGAGPGRPRGGCALSQEQHSVQQDCVERLRSSHSQHLSVARQASRPGLPLLGVCWARVSERSSACGTVVVRSRTLRPPHSAWSANHPARADALAGAGGRGYPRQGGKRAESISAVGNNAGGGGGIRTHGARRPSGFQDRRIRPLCHPSAVASLRGTASRSADQPPLLPDALDEPRHNPLADLPHEQDPLPLAARHGAERLRAWLRAPCQLVHRHPCPRP